MNTTNEDLRNLLRSADNHSHSNNHELSELASLINSLDIDYTKPVVINDNDNKNNKHIDDQNEIMSQYSMSSSLSNRWKDNSINLDDSIQSNDDSDKYSNNYHKKNMNTQLDIDDYQVLRFNKSYMLRGKHGRYLTAASEEIITTNQNTNLKNTQILFHLNVDGQGVGDPFDSISFINIENKEDVGPIKYGMTIALKVSSAKERLLGLREGSKLGFWRNLIGQGEKWQLLKAFNTNNFINNRGYIDTTGVNLNNNPGHYSGIPNNSGINSLGRWGCEEPGSRGKYIRLGEHLIIQTFKTDHLLSIHETLQGIEPKLIYRDRASLGTEVWQVEQYDSIGLPTWYHNRPYLNGQYLVLPHSTKHNHATMIDIQSKAFPQVVITSTTNNNSNNSKATTIVEQNTISSCLNAFPLATQHHLLMRDLLLVLSGIEGQYIKIAAVSPVISTTKSSLINDLSSPYANHNTTNNNNTNTSIAASSIKQLHPNTPILLKHHTTNMYGSSSNSMELPMLSEVTFFLDIDVADRSTANQINILLPVCESAIHVRAYVKKHSQYEYGLVNQALCAAIKQIIRDFDILIAQLGDR